MWQKEQRRLLILSSLGGVLEFYDFIIFAIFAGYISNAFFPAASELSGLFITFATFAIGYLVRPLGGVIFGHFGDRVGRKATFTISILMMAVATLGIGIMPTYAVIGITAPILVIILRIIQGLSVGGEIPGAITYVSEMFPQHKGFACGIIFCALTCGIVLGSVANAAISSLLSHSAMQSFGWRIPFLLGGIFGLLSYLLRRGLHESSQFLAIENSTEKFPIIQVFKQEFWGVIGSALMVALCAVIITALFLFTPAYFTEVLHLPANSYIWECALAITAGSVMCIFFGYITDVINHKTLVLTLIVTTAVLAYPIFIIYVYYPKLHMISFFASSLLMGLSAGTIPGLLSEVFPTKIRYSGVAVSYNIGFAIFGGLTPFTSLSLIYYSGWLTSPALYLIMVSCLATLSLGLIRHKQDAAVTKAITTDIHTNL
ncbi:Major facilitator family transporter [Legionella lansingensis]|uniref:Major facilitator family transporter n=1 Tax=Legionella lansingensis TaxID=45067 RepID=A0A0W0V766_9GAMM|nr:MFS transporter [Legionella lansingensis]KTD15980.1 major facilitator family transporter [Legionella lansingensis]SNV56520.1 Major facilitator family transporter [Legionella lansingensis]